MNCGAQPRRRAAQASPSIRSGAGCGRPPSACASLPPAPPTALSIRSGDASQRVDIGRPAPAVCATSHVRPTGAATGWAVKRAPRAGGVPPCPPPAGFPLPSGWTCDVQFETSLFAPLRWLLAGMDRCQRAGLPPRFQHLIIQHQYVSRLSFPLFSMPVSCQYCDVPSPPRPNADGASLEPGPVCGPAARLPHDTRHRGSASPQGRARCGARPGRNVPPAGAFACSARLDVSGAPSAPCYEDSVVNGVTDQRGVPRPVTTLGAGDSLVTLRTYTLACGPVFGAHFTQLKDDGTQPRFSSSFHPYG